MVQKTINDPYDRPPDYRRSAHLAYCTLLHLKMDRLPVDVVSICRRLKNTLLIPYSQARPYAALMGLDLPYDAPSAEAFTYRIEPVSGPVIHLLLYNDEPNQNRSRFRFTLAHELGHIVLKHKESGYAQEAEANAFAQHLLCPEPLANALREMNTSELIWGMAFGISLSAARIVINEKNRALHVGAAESKAILVGFGVDVSGPGMLLEGAFKKALKIRGL